jgi:putative endonuclease
MMKASRRTVGQTGEALARQFLLERGYEIITTSYRCGKREMDIIARDQETLVFVEVKSNTSLAFGLPEERVHRKKQAHLVRVAQQFLAEHHWENKAARFDVIAVYLGPGLELEHINHIKNAFWAQSN